MKLNVVCLVTTLAANTVFSTHLLHPMLILIQGQFRRANIKAFVPFDYHHDVFF